MDRFDFYKMNKDREEALWRDAIIIFDTSSIGSMYYLVENDRKALCDILTYLKDKIVIPAQVMYEYKKNRNKFIQNPIVERYGTPKWYSDSTLSDNLRNFFNDYKSSPHFHPYFDAEAKKLFEEKLHDYCSSLSDMKKIVKEQHEKRKGEISLMSKTDEILESIEKMNIRKPFSFSELMEIAKDGEFRARNTLPPGYMDVDKKIGLQKYGDLIVWKELLAEAIKQKKPVIFVCDDTEKGDYYEIHKSGTPPSTPRHELIKEFFDCTGGLDIWFYTCAQFIEHLETHYKDSTILPLFDGLEAVKDVLAYQSLSKSYKLTDKDLAVVKCKRCGQIFEIDLSDYDIEWSSNGCDERGMGAEEEWGADIETCCPMCDNEVKITLSVWEYPVGAVNYTSSDSEGAFLIKCPDPGRYFDVHDGEEPCIMCGRMAHLDCNEMCEECHDEIEWKMSRDD